MLELIAAHCTGPDDYAQYEGVVDDFMSALSGSGLTIAGIGQRFTAAYGQLRALNLIRSEDDRTTGRTRIWIAEQWFQLLLDELRNRGRRV